MAIKKGTIKYLDDLWRIEVKLKRKDRSIITGYFSKEVHHIITRSRKNTRWDIDNGVVLDMEQHKRIHSEPSYKKAFIDLYVGRDRYEALQKKSLEYFDKDYDKIKNMLKEVLKNLKEKQKQ